MSRKTIIHQDLFTMPELESLLPQETYFAFHHTRNQLIFSLLIYQAAMPGEITRLKIRHLDLDRRIIRLSGGRMLTARTLPLVPFQLDVLDRYLHVERSGLLRSGEASDLLIVCNKRRAGYTTDSIGYLVETMQARFPGRSLTTKTIRDSVISHWVNEKKIPIEQAQLLAGHRWISSTERYWRANVAEQRAVLNSFFPTFK